MKNLLLLLVILTAQIPCRSQNLASSRKSGASTFIYKITPQEARKIYLKGTKKIDSTFYADKCFRYCRPKNQGC